MIICQFAKDFKLVFMMKIIDLSKMWSTNFVTEKTLTCLFALSSTPFSTRSQPRVRHSNFKYPLDRFFGECAIFKFDTYMCSNFPFMRYLRGGLSTLYCTGALVTSSALSRVELVSHQNCNKSTFYLTVSFQTFFAPIPSNPSHPNHNTS